MPKIITLSDSVETLILSQDVTALPGSAGTAIASSAASSAVTIANTSPSAQVEYKLNAGTWIRLNRSAGIAITANLASDVIYLRRATYDGGLASVECSIDGAVASLGGGGTTAVATAVTSTSTLLASTLGQIVPVNSASAVILTLPSASTAFSANPFGLIVLIQLGVGVPTFAAGGSDTLRSTSGVPPCVQYGMIAAQVISSTEWALA
jgi:hypothetical protein